MHITLSLADEKEMSIVKNFFVAFFYDLSQYDDKLIINDFGLPMWEPSGLPGPQTLAECAPFNWWVRDSCFSYIIRADGKPAGFLNILANKTQLAPEVDFELLDFYIAPKYRRQKIGRAAAKAAFELYHGTWQVFELERNLAARSFWQAVINEYTNGHYTNLDDGTQQRFRN